MNTDYYIPRVISFSKELAYKVNGMLMKLLTSLKGMGSLTFMEIQKCILETWLLHLIYLVVQEGKILKKNVWELNFKINWRLQQ